MHPHKKHLNNRLDSINRIITEYKSLENYYKTLNLFFNLVINNEKPIPELEFTINYKSKQLCYNFPKLPINIISTIASYSYSFISIETRIYFPNNYPFDPPIWRLVNVKTNINTSIYLRSYYKYIVSY
jgi:ubiquitin-protein ligase